MKKKIYWKAKIHKQVHIWIHAHPKQIRNIGCLEFSSRNLLHLMSCWLTWDGLHFTCHQLSQALCCVFFLKKNWILLRTHFFLSKRNCFAHNDTTLVLSQWETYGIKFCLKRGLEGRKDISRKSWNHVMVWPLAISIGGWGKSCLLTLPTGMI